MEDKLYQWKMKSFAKNIDAEEVVAELRHIEEKTGKLTAEHILNSARSKKSILHSMFEWEDSKAAEKYRLSQARQIINNIEVVIISDNEKTYIPVYEIITVQDEGRQYKHIETLTYNEIEQVKENILSTLKQVTQKLSTYKQFDKVIEHIQEAINQLV